MRHLSGLFTGLFLSACLGLHALPARSDAWDEALANAGLTRQTTRFHPQDLALSGEGAFPLPLFDALSSDPLSAPFHMRTLRASLLGGSANAGDLVMSAAGRIGAGTRLTLLGDPLSTYVAEAKKPDALRRAIENVWQAAGRTPSDRERGRLSAELPKIPGDLAEQAAMLLNVEVDALKWRNRGLAPVLRAGMPLPEAFDIAVGRTEQDADGFLRPQVLMNNVDLKRLMVGGEIVAMAADRAATALAARTGAEPLAFRAWTPLGWIIMNGAGNDVVDRVQPNLLIIDSGGDDLYRSGAATYSALYPVSILVDLAGNDRYVNDPVLDATDVMQWRERARARPAPSFGAGVLGYAVLVDAAGNDLYRSTGPTQGRADYGLGLLQDRAGDDRYDTYSGGQGCANFGVAILQDLSGTDTYECLGYSQGYAGTMGFGLLIDRGDGNDNYTANDTILDDPSGQTAEHNTSMAQGVGNGRRADFSDGHSLAGGLGVLLDETGDNTLTCGVFGQGTGYWMGVGMLLMGSGNDTYRGTWYVQGSAAHFAIGLMDDLGGNDSYSATHNMAQGAGHDWSIGWLVDRAGNDRHTAPSLSLGGGNATGFGFFWDASGDDRYEVENLRATIGDAAGGLTVNSVRERNPTLGIFLDSGGKDAYPEKSQGKDNTTWKVLRPNPNGNPRGGERGSGLDIEAPGLPEPE